MDKTDLCKTLEPYARKLAGEFSRDASERDDLFQEAMIVLLETADKLQHKPVIEIVKLATCAIYSRTCRIYQRKKTYRRILENYQHMHKQYSPDPFQEASLRDEVRQVLPKLSERNRSIADRILSGSDLKEIADELDTWPCRISAQMREEVYA